MINGVKRVGWSVRLFAKVEWGCNGVERGREYEAVARFEWKECEEAGPGTHISRL